MNDAGPGRPAFDPSRSQRQTVMVLSAHGVPQRTIAKAIGIDVKTLRRAFRAELKDGFLEVKASMVVAIVRAAQNGAWGAAKYWLSVHCPEWRVPETRQIEGVPYEDLSTWSDDDLRRELDALRQRRARAEEGCAMPVVNHAITRENADLLGLSTG